MKRSDSTHWLGALALATALFGPASNASAQVSASFEAAGNGASHVRVRLAAGARGGELRLPVGTVVSTGDDSVQDLALGRELSVRLGTYETRTVTVESYCLNENRPPATRGTSLKSTRDGSHEVRQIVAQRRRFSHQAIQQALWSLPRWQAAQTLAERRVLSRQLDRRVRYVLRAAGLVK